MDIVEYIETIFGVKLLDCQKVILKNLYEKYKNNKDMRNIVSRYHSQTNFIFIHVVNGCLKEWKENRYET